MHIAGNMRVGKTARDHKSGAWARRLDNQQARANWGMEVKSCAGHRQTLGVPFPAHTCNGKKNRYRVTGKQNKTIFLKGK